MAKTSGGTTTTTTPQLPAVRVEGAFLSRCCTSIGIAMATFVTLVLTPERVTPPNTRYSIAASREGQPREGRGGSPGNPALSSALINFVSACPLRDFLYPEKGSLLAQRHLLLREKAGGGVEVVMSDGWFFVMLKKG